MPDTQKTEKLAQLARQLEELTTHPCMNSARKTIIMPFLGKVMPLPKCCLLAKPPASRKQ